MTRYWVYREGSGQYVLYSDGCLALRASIHTFHSGPFWGWQKPEQIVSDLNNPKPKPITAEDLRVGQTWEWPSPSTTYRRTIIKLVGDRLDYEYISSTMDTPVKYTQNEPSWFADLINSGKAKLIRSEPMVQQMAPTNPPTWTGLDVRTAANAAANEISKAGLTKLSVLEISERVFSAYGKYLVGTQARDLSGSLILNHINPAEFHPPTRQSEDRTMGYVRNALNAQADLIKSRGAQTVELNVKKPLVVMESKPHPAHQANLNARAALPAGFNNTGKTLAECVEKRADDRKHYESLFRKVIGHREAMWAAIPEDLRRPYGLADDMHKAVEALVSQRDQARKELEETKQVANLLHRQRDSTKSELEEANREIERVRVQRNGYIKALDEAHKNHAITLEHVRDAVAELRRGQDRGCPYQGITLAMEDLQSIAPF